MKDDFHGGNDFKNHFGGDFDVRGLVLGRKTLFGQHGADFPEKNCLARKIPQNDSFFLAGDIFQLDGRNFFVAGDFFARSHDFDGF